MFSDLTDNDIVASINNLLRTNTYNASQYAVWWRGKFLSPAQVITNAYQLKGTPIVRRSINTDQAQERLLELGFPIVDTAVQDDFFNLKELNSFDILVNTRYYDKDNPIDKNIGEFISNVVWKKTKIWREKMLELGWYKDNNRYNWQTQSNSKKGNIYKNYTWYKIFPNNDTKKLIFFTIGVGDRGDLYYKIDIKENDVFFQIKDNIKEFRALLDQKIDEDENFAVIRKEDLIRENWKTLIEKTEAYFLGKLHILDEISSHFWPEKRLMRIVWNDNNWQFPIERFWKKSWQGRTDKAFHQQYGFGFEEWLFNTRYFKDGIQYGYVRGIDTMPQNCNFIDELFLYGLHPQTKRPCLIGKLINVELYRDSDEVEADILEIFENGRQHMLEELEEANADTTFLRKMELRPNMSFNLEEATMYEEPIMLDDNILKTPRFIPNIIQDELEGLINDIQTAFNNPSMNFNAGNGTGSNGYTQTITGGKRDVNRYHADITNDLHEYLLAHPDFKNFDISTEKTRICNNLVDCVAKYKSNHILFEVKTTNSVLTNVRLALGQIIEYALLDVSISVKKLIIVGPAIPNKRDIIYLELLKEKLALPLEYWSYSFEEKILDNKFKKH